MYHEGQVYFVSHYVSVRFCSTSSGARQSSSTILSKRHCRKQSWRYWSSYGCPDEEIIYRLAQCSTSETDTCFVRVYAQESRNLSLAINVATRFFKPLSQQSQATLICGYTQYNGLGQILWEIRNQQPTTFYNQCGHSPFSWDSLPNDSYQAYGGYTWGDGVVSINPSTPGQQAQVGHSSVVRQLKFLGIDQGNKTAFIYFDTPGGTWNCLAG